jgi:sulfur carrier protein
MSVTILLNGEPRSVAAPLSVSQLVETLGLAGKRIAVERNGEIVPKSRYASTCVDAGDKLEIVAAVGGG